MASKKDYINLIRWSCIIDSFSSFYFIRVIVLYLLSQSVTSWVAVSIPIVLEFAAMLARGIEPIAKLAIKIDYKKYHILHLICFLLLGFVISQCRSVYTIYLFTFICGILSGIKYSSVTKMNTSNKEYEPYCFIEEERSRIFGETLGLIISQFIYDLNPTIYILGYFILIIIGLVLSLSLKSIPNEDVMSSVEIGEELTKKEKKNTIIATTLFGILAGFWCMGWAAFEELAPLISDKVGYLNSIYTILEMILLFVISGTLINKIRSKNKLLFSETIIACVDVLCLLISAITLSWQGLFIAYILTGITSTMGDPLWGSIISEYSANNRKKYVLVNKNYFLIRAIFTLITWAVCRECVIKGIESFRYLAIFLMFSIITVYLIANKVNKKIFGRSI